MKTQQASRANPYKPALLVLKHEARPLSGAAHWGRWAMNSLLRVAVILIFAAGANSANASEPPRKNPPQWEALFTATAGGAKQEILYRVKVSKVGSSAQLTILKGPTRGPDSEYKMIKVLDFNEEETQRFYELVRTSLVRFKFANPSSLDGGTFSIQLKIGGDALRVEYNSVGNLSKRSEAMQEILEWANRLLKE